jgi:hypothetical protein
MGYYLSRDEKFDKSKLKEIIDLYKKKQIKSFKFICQND